ncbi:MAG: S1 RNA-binding domain-containing protein, partial [Planctomycetaceae bacterium]
PTVEDVLKGAHDILAEKVSEDAEVRSAARRVAWKTGRLTSAVIDAAAESAQPYRDYFQHSEAAGKIPPHRVLAFNRGESAGALRVKLEWDRDEVRSVIARHYAVQNRRFKDFMTQVIDDAVDRLIHPSLEREVRRELTERSEEHAVGVFARNLRNLLLQPPLAGQRVLAIDPGFRTGCKVAALDENGNLLASDLLYCTGSDDKRGGTRARLADLLNQYDCRLIAIGNGTACRETEELVAETISELVPDARYLIVNEAGASIYSTSTVARDEFPDLDATERGTVSIGRRVQDPLSELVKIEPQHIGVGMYQHDLDAKELRASLDQVIESCVNYVGVDLNTASAPLLSHVSGLNQLTARRIVEWRTQNGGFREREQLRKVPGIGQATFTQAAGFLKIRAGAEPLDATWIHPESYDVARQVLRKLEASEPAPGGETADNTLRRERLAQLDIDSLAAELQVGVPTLRDIIDSLLRPGRDPRSDLAGPIFRHDILKMTDLVPGMELRGTVLNVVDFGAFVDVGLKESGLVHVSQMATEFIRSPHDRVCVGDVVTVWVQSVDLDRKRVALSMIPPGSTSGQKGRPSPVRTAADSSSAPVSSTAAPNTQRPKTPHSSKTERLASPATIDSPPTPKPAAAAPSVPAENLPADAPIRSFGQLKDLWKDRTADG